MCFDFLLGSCLIHGRDEIFGDFTGRVSGSGMGWPASAFCECVYPGATAYEDV